MEFDTGLGGEVECRSVGGPTTTSSIVAVDQGLMPFPTRGQGQERDACHGQAGRQKGRGRQKGGDVDTGVRER